MLTPKSRFRAVCQLPCRRDSGRFTRNRLFGGKRKAPTTIPSTALVYATFAPGVNHLRHTYTLATPTRAKLCRSRRPCRASSAGRQCAPQQRHRTRPRRGSWRGIARAQQGHRGAAVTRHAPRCADRSTRRPERPRRCRVDGSGRCHFAHPSSCQGIPASARTRSA